MDDFEAAAGVDSANGIGVMDGLEGFVELDSVAVVAAVAAAAAESAGGVEGATWMVTDEAEFADA